MKNTSYNSTYYPVKRGEFDSLFRSFTEPFCSFKKVGSSDKELFKSISFSKNIFSYDLIEHMVNLILNGACLEYFNFVLDFEYLKKINSTNIKELELAEVILVKQIVTQLRNLDVTLFFNLANCLCSRDESSYILNQLNIYFGKINGFN